MAAVLLVQPIQNFNLLYKLTSFIKLDMVGWHKIYVDRYTIAIQLHSI
jgi:hypothetical protein